MTNQTSDRTFHVRNSEKCYRFKPEAITNHAPKNKGIYELVTFDDNHNPTVLYVGAAFESTIHDCLSGHLDGTLEPSANTLIEKHGNLYFDYLTEMRNTKTVEDAQDLFWWLIQKYKPTYNEVSKINHSGREGQINVIEED